jgi:hypothetical protein
VAATIRYDPIWRRIKLDKYATAFEGAFPGEVDRLERLNNWGALSWLHPHATATKMAHHYGVEHAAQEFLRADSERTKYSPSLRTAAHFLHLGHTPLSYATEEAILRAAHVDDRVRSFLASLVEEVVLFGELECTSPDHVGRCAGRVKDGTSPFDLYRWLAAWRIKRAWPRVWNTVRSASGLPASAKDSIRREVVRTLVCRSNRGYRILGLCNLADFVLRDLLQAGTAYLTVDSGALWEDNPLGVDAAQEWHLLQTAEMYLRSRFYETPEALLVHTLSAKAIAQALLALGGEPAVRKLILDTSLGDADFVQSLPHYHKARVVQVRSAARRLRDKWTHVGRFPDVSVPALRRFEIEDWFTERRGTGRLSYPFTTAVSVTVTLDSTRPAYFAGAERRYALIDLHTGAERPLAGRYALDIVARIAQWLGAADAELAGAALMSWFLDSRCEIRNVETCKTLGLAAQHVQGTVTSSLREMRSRPSFRPLNDHPYSSSLADFVLENPEDEAELVGTLLLGLPCQAVRSSSGRRLFQDVRRSALELARTSGQHWSQGHALEAAVIADQILRPGSGFRFVLSGAVALGDDGSPTREWDVVVVDLLDDGWSATAVECAVTRNTQKDTRARESLDVLSEALHSSFSDIRNFTTLMATVSGDSIDYEDARRGFTT